MKKILVLTDFSDCANTAVKSAIEIAQINGAEIHYLHCKSVPYNWVLLPVTNNRFYPDVTQEVKQTLL